MNMPVLKSIAAVELRKARALIDTPEKWVKNRLAVLDEDPPKYCAIGALWCSGGTRASVRLINEVAADMGFLNAEQLNDDTDHATVMRLYDAAIAKAEES
jgi:RNase adaptor protein for sRNA GlmZ degradation